MPTTKPTSQPIPARAAVVPGPLGRGSSVLVGAALATVLLGLVATAIAGLTQGSSAALGALAGTCLVVGVFAFGSFTVNAVASILPGASLMVALLTYTLQVVVMGVVLVALNGSGLLDESLDRDWLGGTVIAGTLLWLLVQVVLTTRLRIPAFEPVGDAADRGAEAGE